MPYGFGFLRNTRPESSMAPADCTARGAGVDTWLFPERISASDGSAGSGVIEGIRSDASVEFAEEDDRPPYPNPLVPPPSCAEAVNNCGSSPGLMRGRV